MLPPENAIRRILGLAIILLVALLTGCSSANLDPPATDNPAPSPIPVAQAPTPTLTPLPAPTPTTPADPSPTRVLPVGPDPGSRAPDIGLLTLDGQEIRLSNLQGKRVLLNFWTTWCPYCRRERSALQTAHEKYAGDDFIILSVDINEDVATVKAYADEQGLTFPILLDNGPAIQAYQVRGIPASFFITREGTIYDRHVGAIDLPYIEGLLRDIP